MGPLSAPNMVIGAVREVQLYLVRTYHEPSSRGLGSRVSGLEFQGLSGV